MASNPESFADIVKKVRSGDYGCAKCGDLCDCPNADKIITSIANRLEASHKREVAKLRECLEEAIDLRCGRLKCEKGVCFYSENGKEIECTAFKWRKTLEETK